MHKDLWRAVDHLADCKGISRSALARSAGLDPTIFNRSKRGGGVNKERWPSSESIVKVLNVTGVSMGAFGSLVDQPEAREPASPEAKAAAHYHESAERVRAEARFAPDKVLGEMLVDIAQRYERLALWLERRAR